jgi:GNAT superfamily N-acetyltransferase
MKIGDEREVFNMMRVFYNSPAVLNTASDEILMRDIKDSIGDMPFIEGYVFEEDGSVVGYSMIAKSYSTEYGGLCIWIEDLYVKEKYRGRGIGTSFFKYIEKEYGKTAVRFRLEAEKENENAIHVYKKCGYNNLPYVEMTKEI